MNKFLPFLLLAICFACDDRSEKAVGLASGEGVTKIYNRLSAADMKYGYVTDPSYDRFIGYADSLFRQWAMSTISEDKTFLHPHLLPFNEYTRDTVNYHGVRKGIKFTESKAKGAGQIVYVGYGLPGAYDGVSVAGRFVLMEENVPEYFTGIYKKEGDINNRIRNAASRGVSGVLLITGDDDLLPDNPYTRVSAASGSEVARVFEASGLKYEGYRENFGDSAQPASFVSSMKGKFDYIREPSFPVGSNVVGFKQGFSKDYIGEVVIVAAGYDNIDNHSDMMSAPAVMMEAARAISLSGAITKRSILFLLLSGYQEHDGEPVVIFPEFGIDPSDIVTVLNVVNASDSVSMVNANTKSRPFTDAVKRAGNLTSRDINPVKGDLGSVYGTIMSKSGYPVIDLNIAPAEYDEKKAGEAVKLLTAAILELANN